MAVGTVTVMGRKKAGESVKGRQRERWSDRSRETPKNKLKDRITDTHFENRERKQRKTKIE